jgi:hypothetical protein
MLLLLHWLLAIWAMGILGIKDYMEADISLIEVITTHTIDMHENEFCSAF